MRLTTSLLVTLLFASLIVALATGLVVEALEMQRLVDTAKQSNCIAVQSGFSHLRFVGYNLALLVVAIAGIGYAAAIATAFIVRRLVEIVFWRSA